MVKEKNIKINKNMNYKLLDLKSNEDDTINLSFEVLNLEIMKT